MSLEIFFGIMVGLILGLTGAGGGILAVPALVIGLGWSMTQAAPVALMAVGAAAALGAIDGLRKGLVRYRAATLMAVLGAGFTPVGLYVAHRLPESGLSALFSLVLIAVAVRMARQPRSPQPLAQAPDDQGWEQKNCMLDETTGRLKWTLKCSATLALVGSFCGLLTGLLGVGGGFLLVPAFRQLTDIRAHAVVATSLMVIALISLTAIIGALYSGVRIPVEGVIFILACMGGMLAGRVVAPKVSAQVLQLGFAALCVLVAGALLYKTWFQA